MASCRDCPYDSASCRDSRQEAKSHGQSLQEATYQAQQSRQKARDRGQSRRKPDVTDSLCRKRKLADSFIPSESERLHLFHMASVAYRKAAQSRYMPCLTVITDLLQRTQCIFDFETRKKQMFTEARAFSRVTYFFIFWRASWIFFLNLHSEISNLTIFSETVQRDDTNFGPFLFYSVAK